MNVCREALLEKLANEGNCSFYEVLEKEKHCGQNGYLISYGRKYCEKFGEKASSFNQDVS